MTNFSREMVWEPSSRCLPGFQDPFEVLGSFNEWPKAFHIKPVDVLAVSIRAAIDPEAAVQRVLKELKEQNGAWVHLRKFMNGALITGCLMAVPSVSMALGATPTLEATTAASDSVSVSQVPGPAAANMPEVTVIGASDKTKPLSTTKYSGPLNETPQTATVVDQDQMREQGITTLRDALRDVSGISLAAGEFSQQGDTLTVRGFSINHDFFLDGMRDYGSYYRDPFFLEQIEVLQGPSGLLFGDGTTGGAVNQVTKQPSLTPAIQGSLDFGTDDNSRRGTADINEPIPSLGPNTALRLDVMTDQGNVAGRNVAQNILGGLAPTLEFGIGTPTRFTFSFLHEDENSIPDYGVPWLLGAAAPVPRQNYYGFLDDYLRTSVDLESARFEHDFDDNLSFKDQARYGNYWRDARITEPQVVSNAAVTAYFNGTGPLANLSVNPNELAVYSTETSFDNQADLTGKFKTAGIKHSFDVGVEAVVETSNPVRTTYTGVPLQPILNPNENKNFGTGTGSLASVTSASVTTLAGYALDTIDLDERWEILAGLRLDNISSDYSSYVPGGPVTNLSQAVTPLNWRAGLVFKPQENSSVYFVSGTSTDPSAENLSLSSTTANLAPVQMTSFELGTKWGGAENRLDLTASAFWDVVDNAQVEDPNNPALLVNAGTEQARGFNVGIQGYITKEWEMMAGYTFLDAKYLDYVTASGNFGGYPLRNAPQDTFNLFTSYDLSEKISVGAGLNAVTDRNGGKFVALPNGSVVMEDVPGYVTFNAMVKYNLDKNISLQANGTNLGNAYYIDGVHPGHLVPGAARTVLVSTNFKF